VGLSGGVDADREHDHDVYGNADQDDRLCGHICSSYSSAAYSIASGNTQKFISQSIQPTGTIDTGP
jgi:hypothetical protein